MQIIVIIIVRNVLMEILYFLMSLLASMIGAICGIGGGVIIKPVLDATGSVAVSTAAFLSGCTVLSMSVVSLLKSRKSSIKLDTKKSTILAIGAAVGGVTGKKIFEIIKNAFEAENVLGIIQTSTLLIMVIGILIYIKNKTKITTHNVDNVIVCTLIGLILGLLSAFLGIGGGPINIIVLYFFFSMNPKEASRNSIYIILFSQITSFITTLVTKTVPDFNEIMLALMVAGGISGGLIGSIILNKIDAKVVEKAFKVLLFVIAAINVYNIIRFATHS